MKNEQLHATDYIHGYRLFVHGLPTAQEIATPEQERYLSAYCNAGYRSDLPSAKQEVGESAQTDAALSPFPRGFIRPEYMDTTDSFIRHLGLRDAAMEYQQWPGTLAPASAFEVEWGANTGTENRKLSILWEKAHAGYLLQRHLFHMAFLDAAAHQNTLPLHKIYASFAAESILEPVLPHYESINGESIYQFGEWMANSLVNVLFARPDDIDTQIQRQALRIFSREVKKSDLKAIYTAPWHSIGLRDAAAGISRRLPASFLHTPEEMRTAIHPEWRSNPAIEAMMGKKDGSGKPLSATCNQLLAKNPDDLMQIILLHLGPDSPNSGEAFAALHALGKLHDTSLDAVLHDHASYRLLHTMPATSQVPSAELEALRQQAERTQDPAKIRELLAVALARLASQEVDITALQDTVETQENDLSQKATILAQYDFHENHEDLFARHGLHSGANLETIRRLVKHTRRHYRGLYHPITGQKPDSKLLGQLQAELNMIMQIKREAESLEDK